MLTLLSIAAMINALSIVLLALWAHGITRRVESIDADLGRALTAIAEGKHIVWEGLDTDG